jgi:hypothetical protein
MPWFRVRRLQDTKDGQILSVTNWVVGGAIAFALLLAAGLIWVGVRGEVTRTDVHDIASRVAAAQQTAVICVDRTNEYTQRESAAACQELEQRYVAIERVLHAIVLTRETVQDISRRVYYRQTRKLRHAAAQRADETGNPALQGPAALGARIPGSTTLPGSSSTTTAPPSTPGGGRGGAHGPSGAPGARGRPGRPGGGGPSGGSGGGSGGGSSGGGGGGTHLPDLPGLPDIPDLNLPDVPDLNLKDLDLPDVNLKSLRALDDLCPKLPDAVC